MADSTSLRAEVGEEQVTVLIGDDASSVVGRRTLSGVLVMMAVSMLSDCVARPSQSRPFL